jgi:hypothetical protein
MDEPELPSLPQPARADPRPQRPSSFLLIRKRTRSDYDDEPATSSDPATFSSDETAPGAENYASGKRKKHSFKGSWWDRHPAAQGTRTSQRKKRDFQRNFDSGIFMGSESEDPLSSDSFTMEDEFLKDQQSSTDKNQDARPSKIWSAESLDTTPRAKPGRRNVSPMSKEHQGVCDVVRKCLELGKEDVDLS